MTDTPGVDQITPSGVRKAISSSGGDEERLKRTEKRVEEKSALAEGKVVKAPHIRRAIEHLEGVPSSKKDELTLQAELLKEDKRALAMLNRAHDKLKEQMKFEQDLSAADKVAYETLEKLHEAYQQDFDPASNAPELSTENIDEKSVNKVENLLKGVMGPELFDMIYPDGMKSVKKVTTVGEGIPAQKKTIPQ